MADLKSKLVVETDGTESFAYELGSSTLLGLLCQLPEDTETEELFGYLAHCASSEIRGEVASMDNLTEETVVQLSQDASTDVRRRLCGRTPFKEWATTKILLEYVYNDIDCAKTIAQNLIEYSNADVDEVATVLCNHPDPCIREAVASGWGTPKKFLKLLSSDTDASVRISAMQSLD